MIVRRPDVGVREILDEGVLDEADGLVGDNWLSRATSRAIAEGRHLDAMITVMSARMVALLGETDDVRAQAGDQLYVDLDLSHDNLPAGTRIAVGEDAVLEVTAKPHAGCKKFLARFGEDARGLRQQRGREPAEAARAERARGARRSDPPRRRRTTSGLSDRPGFFRTRPAPSQRPPRLARQPLRHDERSVRPKRAGEPTRVGSGAACSTRDLVAVRFRSPAGGWPFHPRPGRRAARFSHRTHVPGAGCVARGWPPP